MAARLVLLAWSGGKDAAWTLHVLRQRADVEVVGLLSTVGTHDGRSTMQGVATAVLRAQARAAGLPLLEVAVPPGSGNDLYLERLGAGLAQAAARWPGLDTLAFGDLHLADLRVWREAELARLGWRIETPLFGRDTGELAQEMLRGGLRARLCCVDTSRLDGGFAGEPFDAGLLARLPATVDACGEHGEFHTCVHAGPMFSAPLALARGATWLRDGRFAVTDFAPRARAEDRAQAAGH